MKQPQGRPTLPKGKRREILHILVSPETMARITATADEHDISNGRAVDILINQTATKGKS